jgi:hypothetical protein
MCPVNPAAGATTGVRPQQPPMPPPRELPGDALARMRAIYRQPGTSFTSEDFRQPGAVVNVNPDSRPSR